MATQNPIAVVGSDGHAPVRDQGRWTTWNEDEIYKGAAGLNKYVPKVNDYVRNLTTQRLQRVKSVHPLTLIPELEDIEEGAVVDPNYTSGGPETYRVYLDKDVLPHVLMVDSRYKPGGSALAYAKIYRGADTSQSGQVVAFIFNSQGQVLTDQIPLELAALDNHTNTSIKVVGPAHTNTLLNNGERVTVVSYNAQGGVVALQDMLVVQSAFIRDVGASTKYITHLSLETPFLSPSNSQEIEYPLNVPLQAFNMFGVAHYNDGSEVRLPVDDTKFFMRGLQPFVATTPGQRFPLALAYRLGPNENAIRGVSADGKFMTEPFWLVATPQNGAYSVKVYGYPQWVDNTIGYRMRWFMLDLNRDIMFDVTPYVRYNTNGSVFNGLAYNQDQFLSFRLVLREVSGAFNEYIHTQTMQVLLRGPGTDADTNWLVGFDPQQNPYYGAQIFARVQMVNQNLWKVNIGNSLGTQVNFLEKVYYAVKPLVDRKAETVAPVPTHFRVMTPTGTEEFAIANWSEDLTLAHAVPLQGTLFIEFIERRQSGDLRLAVVGMAIKAI